MMMKQGLCAAAMVCEEKKQVAVSQWELVTIFDVIVVADVVEAVVLWEVLLCALWTMKLTTMMQQVMKKMTVAVAVAACALLLAVQTLVLLI